MQISGTINHTGRRKLKRSEVKISLHERPASPPNFDAQFAFKVGSLPSDAAVFVEAYHRNTQQRFSFGTVGAPKPPETTLLDELDLSGPVLFRVRIVDQADNEGQLLASASGLRAEGDSDEEQRSSLIVVRSVPMGEQIWRMSFEDNSKPELLINNRIPDPIGQIKGDHTFQALILPAALRETLTFFIWNDEIDDDSIQQEWINFAETLGGDRPSGDDANDQLVWIDDVVDAFSSKFKLCEMLVLRMEGEIE
jgi:hypothetical protein